MAIEFSHIDSEAEKLWIAREFEAASAKPLERQARVDMLKLLAKSQVKLSKYAHTAHTHTLTKKR